MEDFSVDMFFVVRTPSGEVVREYSGEVLSDSTISKIIDDVAKNLNNKAVSDEVLAVLDELTAILDLSDDYTYKELYEQARSYIYKKRFGIRI
jgi:hypothetical protein